MYLRLLNSLRTGLSGGLSCRAPMRRLQRLLEPKELEDMGLYPAELHILAARGRRFRAAELFGGAAVKAPRASAAPLH